MLHCLRNAVDDVAPNLYWPQNPRKLFWRMLQIVVHRYGDIVLGFTNAAERGIVLTEVAQQVNATDPRILVRQVADMTPTSINAAIIDQNDFPTFNNACKSARNTACKLSQCLSTVIDRHHNGH